MSKLDQIQSALKQINQAKFQKLVDAYLHRTLDVKEINPAGSMAGEEKTTKGTPDTLIKLNNEKYVFVESTTQKTNLLKKFSEDTIKCLDKQKTSIPISKIEKIILACNSDLSTEDKKELIKLGKKKHCIIEFLDLSTLAFDLHRKFQPLAKEFLGIEIDTGQILSPGDFVKEYQNSKYATPLDNEFYYRETEKNNILEALNSNDLIVLLGKPGVGKTRLALECAQEFLQAFSSFEPFVIVNKRLDVHEDIKAYFGNDGDYVIIVDDANKLHQLSHILQLLKEQSETRKIKVILTVRDYAVNKVRDDSRDYPSVEMELGRFSDEEISKILENDFGIRHHEYLHRICRIAQGNPRLAIMAANIALDRQKNINDISSLYDEYFDSISKDLDEFKNKKLTVITGIISFFKVLDITDIDFLERVAKSFGLTSQELREGLEELHKLEVVDLDYEVVKISDQILGTYLFYKVFFKDESVSFSILLDDFFDHHAYRLIDSLIPIMRDFDAKVISEKLQPHVDKKWEEIKENEDRLLSFVKVFHFLKKTETLLYLRRKIGSLKEVVVPDTEPEFETASNQSITDPYLQILKLFHGEDTDTVLTLLWTRLEKNLSLLPEVIHLLKEDLCFDHESHHWEYLTQKVIVTNLIEKSYESELYRKIFVTVAGKYLQMRFHSISSASHLSVTTHNFLLIPCESIFEIRGKIWDRIIEFYREGCYQSEIRSILKSYMEVWAENYAVKEIVEKDSEILLPFILSLDKERYEDCVLANAYFAYLENVGVEFDNSLRDEFTSKTYEVSRVLSHDDRQRMRLGHNEYEQQRQRKIESYFGSYTLENYQELISQCEEIQTTFTSQSDFHQLLWPLTGVLLNLANTNRELFAQVVTYLLNSGNRIYLAGLPVVAKLLEITAEPIEIYEKIKKGNFNLKTNWLFSFFEGLDEKLINDFFVGELYNLYETVDLREIPLDFEYLEKYTKADNKILINAINVLFERTKNGEENFNFHYLFNPYGNSFQKLETIFVEEVPLLKEIYLHQCKIDDLLSHEGQTLQKIVELDSEFLFEYLDFLYGREDSFRVFHNGNIDFSFLWEKDDYRDLLFSVFEFTYDREKNTRFFWGPSFFELFFRNLTGTIQGKAFDLLKGLMEKNAENIEKVSHISQIVANCFPEKRKNFLASFLAKNKKFEDFKLIEFENNHIIAMQGSAVPRYEKRISFYESLLTLFNSVDLLEHKLCVEERIKSYKVTIEEEKKRDFMEYN